MLVVLDSNVLISSLLSTSGPPGRIYKAWREKRFEIVTCVEQIQEIRKASRHPRLREATLPYNFGNVINQLKRSVVWNVPIPRLHSAFDPTDSFLLNLAQAAKAQYLVTGYRHARILEINKLSGTKILTARSFCESVLKL